MKMWRRVRYQGGLRDGAVVWVFFSGGFETELVSKGQVYRHLYTSGGVAVFRRRRL